MAELTFIKLFVDYLDAIEPLGDAERGRLFTALLVYTRTGEAPQLGGNERFLFPMMRAQIDRDKAEFEENAESYHKAKSEAGRLGGLAKAGKRKQGLANVAECSKAGKGWQSLANVAKDKEEDKEEDKEKGTGAAGAPLSPPDWEEYRQAFLQECPSLPKPVPAAEWSEARTRALRAKGLSLAGWREACARVEASDFLTGRETGKRWCSLDWLLKPANWQKLVEGNYDNPQHTGKSYDIDELMRYSSLDLPDDM